MFTTGLSHLVSACSRLLIKERAAYIVSHGVKCFDIAALVATVEIAKIHDFDSARGRVFRDFYASLK